MSEAYVANLDRVAAEGFDGETILVHFEQGTYFSLRGAAIRMWSLLEQGGSAGVDQLASAFRPSDSVPPAELRRSIDEAIVQMKEADLVRLAPDASDALAFDPGPAPPAFEAPVIEVYTDLKELISIDPVHEVDEGIGWPVRPPSFGL